MWSSLRSAFRSLSRDRGFTTLAIILIAVTGGATTAVYAVIDAVMLAPMPFADEERTVVIWMRDVARDSPVVEIGLGEAHALHEQSKSLASLGVFGSVTGTSTLQNDDGSRERVRTLLIEKKAFDVIGIRPALGRVFNANDELAPGATAPSPCSSRSAHRAACSCVRRCSRRRCSRSPGRSAALVSRG